MGLLERKVPARDLGVVCIEEIGVGIYVDVPVSPGSILQLILQPLPLRRAAGPFCRIKANKEVSLSAWHIYIESVRCQWPVFAELVKFSKKDIVIANSG